MSKLVLSESGFRDVLVRPVSDDDLSGANGRFRLQDEDNQLQAENDLQAVMAWLYEYEGATKRNYQKEAERLLLWCCYEKGKALSSLDKVDFQDYFDFLQNPTPASLWCGPQRPRNTPEWKPFVKGLSQRSIQQSVTIINGLLNYLVDNDYLRKNPLRGMRRKYAEFKNDLAEKQTRMMTPEEWQAFTKSLAALPEENPNQLAYKERLQFVVTLLVSTGLRAAELKNLKWDAFKKIDNLWWIFVVGKGKKAAKLPVNDMLFTAITKYRVKQKLPAIPQAELTPVVPSSTKVGEGLQESYVNKMLKEVVTLGLEQGIIPESSREKLQGISQHWFKHHLANTMMRQGIHQSKIATIMRHTKQSVTDQYIHAEDRALHEEMQDVKL